MCNEKGEATSFKTPNKERKNRKTKALDDFDLALLRRTIINFHVTEKTVPTLNNIHQKMCEDFGYQGCRRTLLKDIHKLGFRWRKLKTNRKILMERPPIRLLRIEFLRKMRDFRQEGRPIIYMDESYIHSSHTHQKGWSDESNDGLKKPVSKGLRLIIVNAGGENGFVPNAYTRWKSNCSTGDYHNDMNFENYEKWVTEKLIPNLPPRSVVVIDNAPYHNKQKEKCPTSASTKDNMKQWLMERNIPFSNDMLKPQLYGIIQNFKPRYKRYLIDELFNQKGHDVLRLPPYHPDLNPIELVWASMKEYVANKNTNFSFQTVAEYCDQFFEQFTIDQWKSRCEHAKKFEREFMEKEPMVDIVVDDLIINVNDDSDDSDDLESESDCDDEDKSAQGHLYGLKEVTEDDIQNQPSISTIKGKTTQTCSSYFYFKFVCCKLKNFYIVL